MLTAIEADKLATARDKCLAKITKYEHCLPPTNDPQEVAAGELYLAGELKKRSDAIWNAANAKALIHGVIVDKETSKLKPKDNVLLFDGAHINVNVLVTQGTVQYPVAAIRAALAKHNVPQKTIDQVMLEASKPNNCPHRFIATLKIGKQNP